MSAEQPEMQDANSKLEHPKSNPGLREKLLAMITEQRDPAIVAEERARDQRRMATLKEAATGETPKLQKLEEVTGEQGVVDSDDRNIR